MNLLDRKKGRAATAARQAAASMAKAWQASSGSPVMKASSSRTTEFGKMFTAAVMNDGPIFVASIVGCQSGHMAQRCYCWSFSDIWFRLAVLISRLKNIVG
jgi:hypothetical protein